MTMFAVALYPREQQQKTTTTTTTTVAPTAAKVDSTARRNVWFNNVLLSIQDSVCGGNGMTRVEEDTTATTTHHRPLPNVS